MKNILVTGGLGYIGSHVVVELIEAGFNPVILDNLHNSEPGVLGGIQEITGKKPVLYKGDFSDLNLLASIHKENKIAGIIHIAAYKYVGDSLEDPLSYYETNVSGFVRLLKFATDNLINNIVFSSSAAVYGSPPGDVVDEETPCSPQSPYGWSKYMDEIILRDACNSAGSLRGVALRYFNVVGGHDSSAIGELPKVVPQNLLPLIVKAAAGLTPPITVLGNDYPTPDGTCHRDYIHVVDLAKAHVATLRQILDDAIDKYDVFNIGTGRPVSVLELIKTFESVNEVEVPYEIGPRRAGDPVAYSANVEKAENLLHWKSEKSIEDACRDAWSWHKKISG